MGGQLLGAFLTGCDPRADGLSAHHGGGREDTLMIGSLADDLVAGRFQTAVGAVLLQGRLVVGVVPFQFAGGDSFVEEGVHETSSGVSTAGHVNGADHRFHGVGQNGGLVRSPGVYLSLSQPDQFSQVKSTGHLG